MEGMNRRQAPRFNMRVQLSYKPVGAPDSAEVIVHSDNISSRGVYFRTHKLLSVGTPLQLFLRMPREVAGSRASTWCCVGRVVHNRPPKAPYKGPGMGIEFHYYDVVRDAEHTASSACG